ncbi:MAG: YiiX/YebB-like N1pC/P60 family cysteine hydrolase [Myxococcales bacterium]
MTLAILAAVQVALAAVPAEAAAATGKGLYSLPDEEFQRVAQADLAQLRLWSEGLRRVQKQLEARPELFTIKKDAAYTLEQKRTLLSAWGSFYAYAAAIEGMRQRYWGFVKELPTGAKHAWGYLVTHAALTAELGAGLSFADRTAGVPQLEVLLDEPDAEFGIPAKAFAAFKLKVIHAATTTQLFAGDAYTAVARPLLKKAKALDVAEVKWALEATAKASKEAKDRLKKRGIKLFAGNAADVLKDSSLAAVFPVQKDVAEWMGDTRVQRIGKGLITKGQAEELLKLLQPGDVLTARQNWFLSNLGLPGFWKHAELYVGDPQTLSLAFDADPDVKAWVARQTPEADTFTAWLAAKYPEKWKVYQAGVDFQGHRPIRVIESISEGVSFTAVEHALMVDYLAVMRPRVPAVEKARAVARAFEYQGRPYDFDFDFFSDATLVCTELAVKAYAPTSDMKGLNLPLVDVAGRMTLPANDLVRMFDEAYDQPDRQLDFVAFLDGSEDKKAASFADLATFRRSWQRVNWDVLLP